MMFNKSTGFDEHKPLRFALFVIIHGNLRRLPTSPWCGSFFQLIPYVFGGSLWLPTLLRKTGKAKLSSMSETQQKCKKHPGEKKRTCTIMHNKFWYGNNGGQISQQNG